MEKDAAWKAKPHRPEYDQMRERLVAAGWSLASREGVSGLTLNAVAREAECARSSVYRYFDSKEELLNAVLQDRVYSFGVELDKELRKIPDPVEMLVVGMYLAVCAIKEGPSLQLFRQLNAEEGRDLADILQSAITGIASDILQIDPLFYRARREGLVRDDLSDEDIMRWLGIVCASLIQLDDFGRNKARDLAFLRKMLVPSIYKMS